MNHDELFIQEKTLIIQKIDQYMLKVAEANDQKTHDFLYQVFLKARFDINKAATLDEVFEICSYLEMKIKEASKPVKVITSEVANVERSQQVERQQVERQQVDIQQVEHQQVEIRQVGRNQQVDIQQVEYQQVERPLEVIRQEQVVVERPQKEKKLSKKERRESKKIIEDEVSIDEQLEEARSTLKKEKLDAIRKLKISLKKDEFLGWRQYVAAQKVVKYYSTKIQKVSHSLKVNVLYEKCLAIVEKLSYEDDYDTGMRIKKKMRVGLWLATFFVTVTCFTLGYFFRSTILELFSQLSQSIQIIVFGSALLGIFFVWFIRLRLCRFNISITLICSFFIVLTIVLGLYYLNEGVLAGYLLASMLNLISLSIYVMRKIIIVKKYGLSKEHI